MIKKYKYFLIGISAILIMGICGFYVKQQMDIKESIKTYHMAVTCEENENFQEAYNLYSLVISDDLANFKQSREKMKELEKRFEVNKIATLGFELLKQVGEVNSFDELESVKVNADEQKMSCMIGKIGYIIFKGTEENSQYQKVIYNSSDGYCIVKYEAEKEYGGWFSSDINMINQDTSLAIFKTRELTTSSDLISEKLIKRYIEDGVVN